MEPRCVWGLQWGCLKGEGRCLCFDLFRAAQSEGTGCNCSAHTNSLLELHSKQSLQL